MVLVRGDQLFSTRMRVLNFNTHVYTHINIHNIYYVLIYIIHNIHTNPHFN